MCMGVFDGPNQLTFHWNCGDNEWNTEMYCSQLFTHSWILKYHNIFLNKAFRTKSKRNSWHLKIIMYHGELCCIVICEPVELFNLNTALPLTVTRHSRLNVWLMIDCFHQRNTAVKCNSQGVCIAFAIIWFLSE